MFVYFKNDEKLLFLKIDLISFLMIHVIKNLNFENLISTK